MSLQLHDFFARHADERIPTLIVDGDAIIAHVHNPEYVQLFLHAPQMRSLIEKLSAMACDPSRPEHDSAACGVCQARVLLAILENQPDGFSTGSARLDMLG